LQRGGRRPRGWRGDVGFLPAREVIDAAASWASSPTATDAPPVCAWADENSWVEYQALPFSTLPRPRQMAPQEYPNPAWYGNGATDQDSLRGPAGLPGLRPREKHKPYFANDKPGGGLFGNSQNPFSAFHKDPGRTDRFKTAHQQQLRILSAVYGQSLRNERVQPRYADSARRASRRPERSHPTLSVPSPPSGPLAD
jgi:hypothetical protein